MNNYWKLIFVKTTDKNNPATVGMSVKFVIKLNKRRSADQKFKET